MSTAEERKANLDKANLCWDMAIFSTVCVLKDEPACLKQILLPFFLWQSEQMILMSGTF